ncbi:MAG: (2Fe-2S) ferredoxin domain-containing protein [Magnetospiraceae bacterium]
MPIFKHHIFFCTNQRDADDPRGCCMTRGGGMLRDWAKQRRKELNIAKVRVNAAGCLGMCEFGPTVVVYPEGIWYTPETTEDVEAIFQEHILGGKPVERLKSRRQPPKPTITEKATRSEV